MVVCWLAVRQARVRISTRYRPLSLKLWRYGDWRWASANVMGEWCIKVCIVSRKINIKKSYRILVLSGSAHVNVRAVSPCNSLISVLFVVGQVSAYNHLLSTVSLLTPYTVPWDRCTQPVLNIKKQHDFKGEVSWDFLNFLCLAERFRINVSILECHVFWTGGWGHREK